jgi:hypothetical protein
MSGTLDRRGASSSRGSRRPALTPETIDALPEEVRELINPHLGPGQTDDETILAEIGVQISAKRDEAKAARENSGITDVWRLADDAYLGIDEANRHEFADARWAKPFSSEGPLTTNSPPVHDTDRSTVFYRLTMRYVDAATAKVCEILLPPDDKAFNFHPMPAPEVINAKDDRRLVFHETLGIPLSRPLTQEEQAARGQGPGGNVIPFPAGQQAPQVAPPGMPEPAPQPAPQAPGPPGGAPGQSPGQALVPQQPQSLQPQQPRVLLTAADFAHETIELMRKDAKAAETRIYDWMIDSSFRLHFRKVISDGAKLGVGVLKGPVPRSYKSMTRDNDSGKLKIKMSLETKPGLEHVDPRNIFPDPACGENIHDGDFIFHRDYMSPRQVRGLKRLPGYIKSQIDLVLEEGPDTINATSGEEAGDALGHDKQARRRRFEVWYFYGSLTRDEMAAIDRAAGRDPDDISDDVDPVYAVVTLINDCVVKADLNPLDSGELPFHSFPWSRRTNHWAGVGVAEQMRGPQRIVNGALRRMLDNAGISSGIQLAIDQHAIRPADGLWTITPDKVWLTTRDAPPDIRQAMTALEIPNNTEQLLSIIQKGEQMAEETTSIPLVTQGQSRETTPDTFGATQLQDNNANSLLRAIGNSFDDYITEPLVKQYYEWLLLDENVPEEEKGEWRIDAHGSSALVEKAIQDQSVAQSGAMAANPIYGVNPKKWAKQFYRIKRLDPDDFMYTEEEEREIKMALQPQAPQVQAAQITADANIKIALMKQQGDQLSIQHEQQIAQAANALEGKRVDNEAQATQADATIRLHEMEIERQIRLIEYANRRNISLDAAKAQLARTAMQLQTERELNASNNAMQIHESRGRQQPRGGRGPRPAVQAPGRAENGMAFEQTNPPPGPAVPA